MRSFIITHVSIHTVNSLWENGNMNPNIDTTLCGFRATESHDESTISSVWALILEQDCLAAYPKDGYTLCKECRKKLLSKNSKV